MEAWIAWVNLGSARGHPIRHSARGVAIGIGVDVLGATARGVLIGPTTETEILL